MERYKYRLYLFLLLPPSSSTMDFDLFLDSFANSIFNGTSTFGGVGTSIVNGIEVSGITIDKSQNRLSVILSNTATEVGIDNNITGTETTTTTTTQYITDHCKLLIQSP